MTRSGKENKQGGVLLQKLSKVHKTIAKKVQRKERWGPNLVIIGSCL